MGLIWRTRPILSLVVASFSIRLLTSFTLLILAQFIPSFDTSASLIIPPESRLTPLLRWDSLYFVSIAKHGYRNEQEAAFMPGLPGVMRVSGEAIKWTTGGREVSVEQILLGGVISTAFVGIGATMSLYHLTLSISSSPSFSLLTSLIYLLPPSPPTLNAVPYTEPYTAFFTFAGMYFFTKRKWVLASAVWGAGTLFRAQGIVLGVGFFGWQFILKGPKKVDGYSARTLMKNLPTFLLLSAISVAPWFAFQRYIHSEFCGVEGAADRSWCTEGLGTSYGFIQSYYWDVGFLRYWTVQQLPNFILALPVLAFSFAASITYYTRNASHVLSSTLPFLPFLSSPPQTEKQISSFLTPSITPFVHLHTALTFLLLFASHTQIILRVCVTNPVLFWFIAHLQREKGKDRGRDEEGRGKGWGRWWVKYCVVWGAVSTVLWTAFLPPA